MAVKSNDEFSEANTAFEVVKERSNAIFQRSERLRSIGKKLEAHTENWVSEQHTLDEQHASKCEELVSTMEAAMATLKTQLLEYNDARSKNESEEREYAQEMEDIKDRISTLEQKRVFSDEQSVLQPEIDSRNEQLEIRRAQLEQHRRRSKRKESKLVDQYNCYRKSFGLHVRTTDATTMEFVFKHIDRNDPEAAFSVSVSINGPDYHAKSCTPLIPHFHELAHKLEHSGESELKSFLWAMRKGFQEYAAE